ncbi:MAG: hypothetical protein ACOX6H_03385 [Christensenellales bacterium]|jgi:predicted adenylyl cyclase CyaB
METEVTYQIFNTLSETLDALEKNGYKLTEKYQLIDLYFTHFKKEEIEKLDYQTLIKNSFLVRQIIEENCVTNNLVYKHKQFNSAGNVIEEQKIKVEINSPEKTAEILTKAGLTNWCTLNDKIHAYEKDGIIYSIQDVENLGLFVEVEEYESIKHLSAQEKLAEMQKIVKNLPLKTGAEHNCKKPYMLLQKNGVV